MYSQNNEDEIIAEIFEKIGTTNKVFVEIGAGDGTECNTRALREKGWIGFAFDRAFKNEHVQHKIIDIDFIRHYYDNYLAEEVCLAHDIEITHHDLDFLSIDIDSNDYHILHALFIKEERPRVICCEYNKHFGDKNIVMGYDEDYEYDGLTYDYGASKTALIKLCEHYGYEFWGTDENEVNCFFVHKNA